MRWMMIGGLLLDGARLAAVRDSSPLGGGASASLERLNHLAVELLAVPGSVFSLVGERSQLLVSEATRDDGPRVELPPAFAERVVERDAPLLAEQAAGVPVRLAGGETLGAFCALD